jgi:hypothetical protein
MSWQEWNSWNNPLWSWIVSVLLLFISGYGFYMIGAYTIKHHDWIDTIMGCMYFGLIAWGSSTFALRAVQLMKRG